jgi:hypothetical protein
MRGSSLQLATKDAIARQREARRRLADSIGGRGYRIHFAGVGIAEIYWDALIAERGCFSCPTF